MFFRLMSKITGFLQYGTSMAMAIMNLIGVFVTKLWPVQGLACGGGGDGGDGGDGGGATRNIISPKFSNFGDIIMGKWAKPGLSDIENELSNYSIKIHLLTVDQYHPQEAVYKTFQNVIRPFLRKLGKSSKTAKFYLFWSFLTLKNDI